MKDLMTMHLRHQAWLERHGQMPPLPRPRNRSAKITDEQVIWARNLPLQEDTVEYLMKALSISQTTAYGILSGRLRSELDPPRHPKYVAVQRKKRANAA